mmetsp:Transcript_68269/g.158437  ORF Transcript_68269/g.158437 Transcript_68269/m.158437 type:complete len:285 (+) Transcript_68269:423-1277(+)
MTVSAAGSVAAARLAPDILARSSATMRVTKRSNREPGAKWDDLQLASALTVPLALMAVGAVSSVTAPVFPPGVFARSTTGCWVPNGALGDDNLAARIAPVAERGRWWRDLRNGHWQVLGGWRRRSHEEQARGALVEQALHRVVIGCRRCLDVRGLQHFPIRVAALVQRGIPLIRLERHELVAQLLRYLQSRDAHAACDLRRGVLTCRQTLAVRVGKQLAEGGWVWCQMAFTVDLVVAGTVSASTFLLFSLPGAQMATDAHPPILAAHGLAVVLARCAACVRVAN